MTRLQIIVARARNGVIGREGLLPWHLPEDLAHFKRTTMGHPIIMGRATWESIGRPLPGRRSIVVTRNPDWHAAGAERASSLDEAVRLCGGVGDGTTGEDEPTAFLIGGAQLFEAALRGPVDGLYLTQINADFDGDVHFGPIDPARWRECERTHVPAAGERNFSFDFIRYEAAAARGRGPRAGESDAQ